jgi:hypothetical protein
MGGISPKSSFGIKKISETFFVVKHSQDFRNDAGGIKRL